MKEKKRQGVLVIISSHVMSELDLIADSLIGVCDGKSKNARIVLSRGCRQCAELLQVDV